MSSEILLNRLLLTGKLDENTPLEIIVAIADVNCIDYSQVDDLNKLNELIIKINSFPGEVIHKPRRDEDYEKISHFINPNKNVIWNKDDLEVAYLFLMSFTDPKHYKDVNVNFVFGSQTPENLRSLNECVIYSICRYYGIELSINTRINDMINMLKSFLSNEELIIESISNKLINSDLNTKRLLEVEYIIHKFIHPTPKKISKFEKGNDFNGDTEGDTEGKTEGKGETAVGYKFPPDYQKISKIAEEVNTHYLTEDAIRSYKVKTHEDAIVVISILYGYDITNQDNPLDMYRLLIQENGKPANFDFKFNNNFCIEMYTTDILKLLLKNEGYLDDDLISLDKDATYESLQIISLSNTFYHGKKMPFVNKETYIDTDDVNDLKSENCISFGNDEGYIIYKYSELYGIYNNSKILYDPTSIQLKNPLSSYSIKKLRFIVKNNCPVDIKKDFMELLVNLDNAYNSSDSLANKIKEDVSQDSTGVRNEVLVKFMNILIKLSMNMRGWSGKGEYPIKEAHKLDQEIIDLKVTESLTEMHVYAESYPDLCGVILNLPLVRYCDGRYLLSDEINGITIGDRIKIIKSPKTNAFSCIKISSNWLASSSYKYCKYFDIDPKFKIEDLKYIS